jgi:hypothetical protein
MSIPLNCAQSAGGLGERRQSPPAVAQTLPPLQAPRLLDQLRERIRVLHCSRSTEDAYVHWCKAFVRFHGKQHPKDLIYTHVLKLGGRAVRSPLDALGHG